MFLIKIVQLRNITLDTCCILRHFQLIGNWPKNIDGYGNNKKHNNCFLKENKCIYHFQIILSVWHVLDIISALGVLIELNLFHQIQHQINEIFMANKTAAKATGPDLSQCNSINRQNPPIQQNCCNFEPMRF